MDRKYAEYATNKAVQLLAIDSPTGFTDKAAEWVKNEFSTLGFDAKITAKGGVLVDLGGENDSDALLLEAHTDTLGGMVAEVKGSGRLKLTNLGGMRAENAETENARVYAEFQCLRRAVHEVVHRLDVASARVFECARILDKHIRNDVFRRDHGVNSKLFGEGRQLRSVHL